MDLISSNGTAEVFELQASKLVEEFSALKEELSKSLEPITRSADELLSILLKEYGVDSAKEEEGKQSLEKYDIDFSVEAMWTCVMKKINEYQSRCQVRFTELTKDELEETCFIAMKVLAVNELQSQVTLEKYLEKVFHSVSTEVYSRLKEAGRNWVNQDSDGFLSCQVLWAENLKARDADGFSDPYCILGVVPKDVAEHGKGHPHLQEWKKEGIVEELFYTQVLPNTLNPTWNESFEIRNSVFPRSHVLVVEVWDGDVPDKELEAKGLVGKFDRLLQEAKDKFHKHFIGCASHPIRTEPEDVVLDVIYHSAKHLHGRIKLQLDLHIHNLKETPDCSSLGDHHKLAHALVAFESVENSEHVQHWHGQLSQDATLLLSIHATTFYLSGLQQATALLAVILDYHQAFHVQVSCFQKLISEINKEKNELTQYTRLYTSIPEYGIQLLDSLKEVWSSLVEFMNHYFLSLSADGLTELEETLLTLKDLYQIRAFVFLRLHADNDSFKSIVASCIEASTSSVLTLRCGRIAAVKDETYKQKALLTLFDTYIEESEEVEKLLQPLVYRVDHETDYFSVYIYVIGKFLFSVIQESYFLVKDPLLAYQLYQRVQKLVEKCRGRFSPQTINDLYKNFRSLVPAWIDAALSKARQRIESCTAMDQVKEVSESVNYTSSAVDVIELLDQVVAFWTNLDQAWPDKAEATQHTVTIVKGIGELACFYIKEFFKKKVCQKNLMDKNGRFHVTKELFFAFTNLNCVKQALKNLPKKMDLEHFLQNMRVCESSEQSEMADRLLHDQLEATNKGLCDEMGFHLKAVLTHLFHEVKSFIILILSPSAKKKPTIDQMLDYLQTNMSVFVQTGFKDMFMRILYYFWMHIAKILKDKYEEIASLSNSKKHQLYQTLWNLTDAMRNFFQSGGDGLTEEMLNTNEFRMLMAKLEFTKLCTNELITKVLSTIVEQQQVLSHQVHVPVQDASTSRSLNLGTLHFSHRYLVTEGVLEVDLLYAEKLTALRNATTSCMNMISRKVHPYVELVLLPEESFPGVKSVTKSTIKHGTNSPTFNESFQLPASMSAIQGNSVLLLAVCDHDFLGNRHFAGMCAISCSSVPFGDERQMEHLPLFEYLDYSYTELSFRSEEEAAHLHSTLKKFILH